MTLVLRSDQPINHSHKFRIAISQFEFGRCQIVLKEKLFREMSKYYSLDVIMDWSVSSCDISQARRAAFFVEVAASLKRYYATCMAAAATIWPAHGGSNTSPIQIC